MSIINLLGCNNPCILLNLLIDKKNTRDEFMSRSVHVASALCISHFLREQKKTGKADKNNCFPDIPTQLGLKKLFQSLKNG